jgi:hypothetical protein
MGKVGVKLGKDVGENVREGVGEGVRDGVGESVEGVNGCKVGEYVGVRVCVGTRVVLMFPSTRESEKPPRIKPMEARAMMIPRNTCHKFFIASSL